MASLKELLKSKQIKEIDWVNTKDQLADVLTKNGVNKKLLTNLINASSFI